MILAAKLLGCLTLTACLASGCAFDIADVKYSQVTLQAQVQRQDSFVLEEDVPVTQTPCWYSRTLRKNTRWEFVGTLIQGNVYRSRDQNLTVECSNIFEAYLVIAEPRLVGFFLPVESGFVPISNPIPIPMTRKD